MDSWYRLRLVRVKYKIIKRLMEVFDEYEDIFKLPKIQLLMYCSMKEEDYEKLLKSRKVDLKTEQKKYENEGVEVVSLKDEKYPFLLKNIAKPPVFLYVKGKVKFPRNTVGVVGTRKMTKYGENACEKIVNELVDADITIISGLALGIDGIAHKKTLAKGGSAIAVVGSGLDIIYPKQNRELWNRLEKKGTLVSEYPLGTPPMQYNFPARNRIIVGLSRGIIVVESRSSGGSLITAENALDENRDVYAVPGDIFSPSSIGTNNLIRDNKAKLIESGIEVLEDFGWKGSGSKIENSEITLEVDEAKIFEALKQELNLDELISETLIPAGDLLAYLMEMELKGIVSAIPGGKYRRKILV